MTDPALSGICVLGRTDFATGVGKYSAAALELFSRYYDVSFFPTRHPAALQNGQVRLPNGRQVPVADKPAGFAVYFFADVLWNGVGDFNHRLVPREGLRIAQIAYDSDEFPPEWVAILNSYFDLLVVTSSHLVDVAARSGVRIATMTLPLAIELESLIARRYSPPVGSVTRFGTVSAFHQRKNLDVLVEAFISTFGDRSDVELVIHSNLAVGDTQARVRALARKSPGSRITITHGPLDEDAKNDLIDSFDVFLSASSGEGYSIGPREALALGKPAVLSRVPAHEELAGVPGVFLADSDGPLPAVYPEINNRVFGSGARIPVRAVGEGMLRALEYLRSENTAAHADERKALASRFTFTALAQSYARIVDPDVPRELRPPEFPPVVDVPARVDEISRSVTQRYGRSLGSEKIVIPLRDAGFFSIFNTFMTHMTWAIRDNRPAIVLPDWDAGRLIASADAPITSYCYSQPDGGNMWLELFEPPYGLSADDLNDREFLYGGSTIPLSTHNAKREPFLTYVNAFELYRAPWFQGFRNQYNSAYSRFVQLRPELQAEMDAMRAKHFGRRFTIAVHVKHPSHAVEQPGQMIAGVEEYIGAIRAELVAKGIREGSDDWRLFVATDQERVVAEFVERFGSRVIQFADVTRVNADDQAKFDSLDESEKLREGHQLQHIMAADSSRWSSRLAWEVWRDAEAMAASDVLIHAVSNVATAVSYLGPAAKMVYCEPAALAG